MSILHETGSVLPFAPRAHQRRVDAAQDAIRSETAPSRPNLFRAPPQRPQPSRNALDHRIAEELEFVARQLDRLGGILAEDAILVLRHAAPLQSIDLMKQTLGHLGHVMAAEDKSAAASLISLPTLKARLQRKPLRPLGNQASAP
jgi:hypothetical protein